MPSKPWRTCFAQAIYFIAGLVSRVQVPHRTFTLTSFDPPKFAFAGWRSGPFSATFQLLELSERLDPHHYEHWAVFHPEPCSGGRCPACRGVLCAGRGETEHCATPDSEES